MGGTARRRAVLVDEALHGITEISEQMPVARRSGCKLAAIRMHVVIA